MGYLFNKGLNLQENCVQLCLGKLGWHQNQSCVNEMQHSIRGRFSLRSQFTVEVPKITSDDQTSLMLMIRYI